MGTYLKGILGPFSGTVGAVVGASFRGKDVMRSRPRKSSKLPTLLQEVQRAKFTKATQLLSPARMVLSNYFGVPTGAKSRFNMAMAYHLQNAIMYDGLEAFVDYEKVELAKGSLLGFQNLKCENRTSGELNFTWEDNSNQGEARPTDVVKVVLLQKDTTQYEFFLNVGTREEGSQKITLPTYLQGTEQYVYAFLVSQNNKAYATSQYLGSFTIT
ncbi:MAG: hypothetical protein EOO07_09725 [Chitinophagaceae bacterium]|nr:MAG: hypothetical protein EOO07_09725 [Chitinophagaceae bacterium]